jgi:hypothetical protein
LYHARLRSVIDARIIERMRRLWVVALTLAAAGCEGRSIADAGMDAAMDGALDSIDVAPPDDGLDVFDAADAPPPPPPPVELGRHIVSIVDTRRIVPSTGLPPQTIAMNSNNNLDVVRHDGRIYLGWRTAPDHFASEQTRMYIVSSTDEMQWRFEAEFSAATDVREPRFLSLNGGLYFYLARLGTDRLAFQPMGMSYSALATDGTWSPLAPFYRDGFIAWRTKVERGVPYMLAYFGGEHEYLFDQIPLDLQFLTTSDGVNWRGVNSTNPTVYRGGGSETDFVITDDGSLLAVVRNEGGDDTGWGSLICRAPASDITQWSCHHDARKFDSPLMFWHDGEAYLIARRNVTVTGDFDLNRRDLSYVQQAVQYELDYRERPKRCSLWRWDQTTDRIVFILDLPSRGDTCFPGIVDEGSGDFAIYNYSSDIDGPDLTWRLGQLGPTYIYRTLLRFTPNGPRDL